MQLSPLSAGTVSFLNLCKSYAGCHSIAMFICALALSLEDIVSLESSITSGANNLSNSS